MRPPRPTSSQAKTLLIYSSNLSNWPSASVSAGHFWAGRNGPLARGHSKHHPAGARLRPSCGRHRRGGGRYAGYNPGGPLGCLSGDRSGCSSVLPAAASRSKPVPSPAQHPACLVAFLLSDCLILLLCCQTCAWLVCAGACPAGPADYCIQRRRPAGAPPPPHHLHLPRGWRPWRRGSRWP
jgi:hypothetical protein